MNGAGYIELDIVLFMMALGAAGVNAKYLWPWWRESRTLGMIRVLRFAGWCILSARFGHVLYVSGDLPISLPSLIGLGFLAAGEIAVLFNRGKAPRL